MSLITPSYFVGPLTIAQLGQASVNNDLILKINRYETEFLQAVLGIELYQDFITGLTQPTIDPMWLSLRDGTIFNQTSNFPGYFPMYFYQNWLMNPTRKIRWVGFTSANTFTPSAALGPQLVLTTGSGVGNPVAGTNSFTLPSLAGATYSIERRSVGSLILNLDYSLTNNNQTITLLKAGDVFGPGEILILHFNSVISSGIPANAGQSPLAGYIYYKYMRDLITSTTGSGIVQGQSENTVGIGVAGLKMRDAWNHMCDDISNLWFFLAAQGTGVYSSYNYMDIDFTRFKKINMFNL